MATAQEVINQAALQAGILADGQTLDNDLNSDSLTRLNRMLARWKNNGVDLGVSKLEAADILYVDDSDLEAIEWNLSARLMQRHRRPLDAVTVASAGEALQELQAKYTLIGEMPLDIIFRRRLNNDFNIEID